MDVGVCGYIWMWVDVDVYGCGWMCIWMYMDVDGPPDVWPGYAPVWGLCADLLEKLHFFVKMKFFVNFSFRALKLAANREKQLFTFFGFLPPYFDVSRSLG